MSVPPLVDRPPTIATALAEMEWVAQAGAPLVTGIATGDGAIAVAERLRRLGVVAVVDAMQAIHDSRVYVDQGHRSAKVMVAHLAGLSGGDAHRLDKIRRMVIDPRLDPIAHEWRCGRLGVDQATLLSKVYANPRVREQFTTDQTWFIARAQRLPWHRFEKRIARWVELQDDDGATPTPDPSHERRDASIAQDHFSKAWHVRAQLGSIDGSRFNEVFGGYVEAEFAVDWEAAKAELGDAVTRDDLARTDAQRRADALTQMAEDAAANRKTSVRVKRVHNLVWQGWNAEELFRRWSGAVPRPLDPDSLGITDLDGNPMQGESAMVDLVAGVFRRVVQDAAGVTIDMSREQRFFTGLARLGVELQSTECYWPGCHRPVTQCQIDHLRSAACGGLTEQSNGGPGCPTHNRVKEAGYVVTRRADGTMHIVTPNGEVVR
ncbi:MAG: hypothetical protein AAF567_05770 [Actinomycetota bacterium]